jgi:parallel beta-helix repeat protein
MKIMQKSIVIGIILLFVGASIVSAFSVTDVTKPKFRTSSNRNNTLYVGGSGPGNYTTIQSAIDAASSGDIIFVYSGTYNENLCIDKSINLIGEDKDTTVIDGNSIGDVIYIISGGINISEFTIKNSGDDIFDCGIEIRYSDRINISNNIIGSNRYKGTGILTIYSNENQILNNIIYEFHRCIDVRFSDYSNISFNHCENIIDAGILLGRASYNNISNNYMSNSNNIGIHIAVSQNNIIENNYITHNDVGMHFVRNKYNEIKGNEFSYNDCGIQMWPVSSINTENIISGNCIHDNTNGVEIWITTSNYTNNDFFFFNNFYYNVNNIKIIFGDIIDNIWNSPQPVTYTYNGNTYVNYLGNYWDDYTGDDDTNGDGIGDNPHSINGYNDYYPLMKPIENYFICGGNQPPNKPTLNSPGTPTDTEFIIKTKTPTFEWNEVSCAEYYGLYISRKPYGENNLVYDSEDKKYNPSGKIYGDSFNDLPNDILKDGGKYRWDMRAFNNYGASDFSNELYFKVQIPKYKPKISIPYYAPTFIYAHEGTTISYALNVSNEGEDTDTIHLEIINNQYNWNVFFSENDVILEPGESVIINMYETIGVEDFNKVSIEAKSNNDPSKSDKIMNLLAGKIGYGVGFFAIKLGFTNNDLVRHTIILSASPNEVKSYINFEKKIVTLSPSKSDEINIIFDPLSSYTSQTSFWIIIEDLHELKSSSIKIDFNDCEIFATDFDISLDSYKFGNWGWKEIFGHLIGQHCYGMSETSILYYNYRKGKVPSIEIPDNKFYTYELSKNKAKGNIIRHQLRFNNLFIQSMILRFLSVDETEEFTKLKENISLGNPMILNVRLPVSWGADKLHSVVAYKIVERNNLYYIFIYDNEASFVYKGMSEDYFEKSFRYAVFDLNNNKFDYMNGFDKFIVAPAEKTPDE